MKAWKLFRKLKSGEISPLFINKKLRLNLNVWCKSENHPTKGFVVRKGWHCCQKPTAPHLSKKNRVWKQVEIKDFIEIKRPKSQGGVWFLADKMKVLI